MLFLLGCDHPHAVDVELQQRFQRQVPEVFPGPSVIGFALAGSGVEDLADAVESGGGADIGHRHSPWRQRLRVRQSDATTSAAQPARTSGLLSVQRPARIAIAAAMAARRACFATGGMGSARNAIVSGATPTAAAPAAPASARKQSGHFGSIASATDESARTGSRRRTTPAATTGTHTSRTPTLEECRDGGSSLPGWGGD